MSEGYGDGPRLHTCARARRKIRACSGRRVRALRSMYVPRGEIIGRKQVYQSVYFDLLRTLRTITESQFVVMRRSDLGVGDSGALRMAVGRSHDRRGGHLATMGSGRLEAR